jgi:feruloyl-CoA synthase
LIDKQTGLNLLPHDVRMVREGSDLIMSSNIPMGVVVDRTADWLHNWAETTPDNVFLAGRTEAGWREVTFKQALETVRRIATSLGARNLGQDTPIVILSGNSVNHALLSFGAQYAGVPTVPLAEQYSLINEAHGRMIYVLDKVRPAMAYTDDARLYAAALALPQLDGVEIVATRTDGAPGAVTSFASLVDGDANQDADALLAQTRSPKSSSRQVLPLIQKAF